MTNRANQSNGPDECGGQCSNCRLPSAKKVAISTNN